MADKPIKWKVPYPDGRVYEVETDDPHEAQRLADEQVAQDTRDEFHNMPLGQKIGQSFADAGRNVANAFTLGSANQLVSGIAGTPLDLERFQSQQARIRQGLATIPADVMGYGALATQLPTAVPKVMESIGGPAAVRALTGTTAAGIETAALGGGEAAIGGTDIGEGMESGAVAGPLGLAGAKTVGAAIPYLKKGATAAKDIAKGIFSTEPSPKLSGGPSAAVEPPAGPISAATVDEAATRAAIPKVIRVDKGRPGGAVADLIESANKAAEGAVAREDLVKNANKWGKKATQLKSRADQARAAGSHALADDLARQSNEAAGKHADFTERATQAGKKPDNVKLQDKFIAGTAVKGGPGLVSRSQAGFAKKNPTKERMRAHGDLALEMFNNAESDAEREALKQQFENPDNHGYMTDTGRFVTHEEAAGIAHKAGQIHTPSDLSSSTIGPPGAVDKATAPKKMPLKEALKEGLKTQAGPAAQPKGVLSEAPLGTASAAKPGNLGGPPKAAAAPKSTKKVKTPADERAEAVRDYHAAIANANRQAKSATGTGFDTAVGDEFKNLLKRDSFTKNMSPDELAAMEKVISGDPAVRAGRKLGTILHPLSVAGGVAGGGMLSVLGSHPVLGTALATGIPAVGVAGRATASAGTKALTKKATSVIMKEPKKEPNLNPQTEKDIYNLMRLLGIGQ